MTRARIEVSGAAVGMPSILGMASMAARDPTAPAMHGNARKPLGTTVIERNSWN